MRTNFFLHTHIFNRRFVSLKYIEEPGRKVPILAETDVLVIGGGPAGISAALAAAREGVATMII